MHMHHSSTSTCKRGVFEGDVRRLMSLFEGWCRDCSTFSVKYQRMAYSHPLMCLSHYRPFVETYGAAFLASRSTTSASTTVALAKSQKSSHNENLKTSPG